MPKGKKSKFDEGGLVETTGKWNTAKDYSQMMIMDPLFECKEMRKICYHGTSSLIDEFIVTEDQKIKARIHALERYITTLTSLIIDTVMQVKPDHWKEMEVFELGLNILYKSLPLVKDTCSQDSMAGTYHWIEINEDPYNFILEKVIEINKKVSGILTANDLLFYTIEEFDMDKAKDEFLKNIEEEG